MVFSFRFEDGPSKLILYGRVHSLFAKELILTSDGVFIVRQTLKCPEQCEQWSCKIYQDLGKIVTLNMSCSVVNPFYVELL